MSLKKHLLFIFLLLFHTIIAQKFLNLDFEKVNDENRPLKWNLTGNNYLYNVDNTIKFSGNNSLKIVSNSPQPNDFASFFYTLPLELFRGKELRFVGKIKVQSVQNGNAGLWVRVNDANNKIISFDNMSDRRVTGNTDWKEVSVTMKISPDAEKITLGGLFKANGTAWFDDFKLFADNNAIEDISKKEKLTLEESDLLKKYIYPLKTYDPNSADNNDLKILKKLIGDSKTVALGEVTHGSSEIFKMKDRMIRYMVQNDNFNIFSIEAAMPESYEVNNYTIGGERSAKNYLSGMHFWTWKTIEVVNMIEWMKKYNQSSNNKVYFTGFDMQSYAMIIKTLKGKFSNQPAILNEINKLNIVLNTFKNEIRNDKKAIMLKNDKDMALTIILQLKKEINTLNLNKKDSAWIHQNLRILEQYTDLNSKTRDQYMAENLLWIKENNPDSKIVLWAHNTHIKKTDKRMGNYLSEKLGSDYITFGFAFDSGTYTAMGNKGLTSYEAQKSYPGTYEYILNSINEPYFILDLKKIKEDNNEKMQWIIQDYDFRITGSVNHSQEFFPNDISKDFDYLIFIKQSTNSTLFK